MSKQRLSRRLHEIRGMLQQQQIDGIILQHQKNVSWLIGGRSHVNMASEPACCVFIITRMNCVLISNNIESDRLIEEEMGLTNDQDLITVKIWPWNHPDLKNKIISQYSAQIDKSKMDGELENELLQLRSRVDEEDELELLLLGQLTVDAIEQTALNIAKGQSEFQIAGELARHCLERELEPIVNLIAVDERTFTRRHPQPTSKILDKHAMLVVCGRRNGLIASASRLVYFGSIPTDILTKHKAVVEIDAKLMNETRPGNSMEQIFQKIPQFYEQAGYPEEYKFHHQGGLTGYSTRERLALAGEKAVVSESQVYAWNPSIAGVKSEDTVYVKNNLPSIITLGKHFPLIEIRVEDQVWKRPGILQRG
jgi:Xaa-Pro aminopeptidase